MVSNDRVIFTIDGKLGGESVKTGQKVCENGDKTSLDEALNQLGLCYDHLSELRMTVGYLLSHSRIRTDPIAGCCGSWIVLADCDQRNNGNWNAYASSSV